MKSKNHLIKKIVKITLSVIFILGFLGIYANNQQLKNQLVLSYDSSVIEPEIVPEKTLQEEVIEIEELVSKHIILPKGEEPNIATIQDIESLVIQQPFFQGAMNGDKILIYTSKAIIYSPIRDRLINVGPIYLQDKPETSEQALDSSQETEGTEEEVNS